ncbi:MAG: carboxymuconolactone decarboxylase family protein [Burkholderiales bacterium]|nr:carboxymuconolactone decarboxylase family protein [Burkholderiales bacterium]
MERLNYNKISPDAVNSMMNLENFVNSCGLEKQLLELVKLRASQINGCAYCVDVHTTIASKAGESQQRLHAVAVWQESPLFTQRERAALAWTEAVTLLSQTHAPDNIYQEVIQNFDEKETINLTMAIITINAWNRLAVSFRKTKQ